MNPATFKIEAQEDTPLVIFEKTEGKNVIVMKGILMPENAFDFFQPLSEKVFSFFENISNMTLDITLDYMNSMSNKQILKLIVSIYEKSNDLKVIWRHKKDDELIKLKGEEFQSVFPNINISIEAY
ncbi:MAG: SiaC family regulatory phosphoprotein [Bacteroidota bacterium]|jgi:hypothetical protein